MTTTTLTPSALRAQQEQAERNARIAEVLRGVHDAIADKSQRGQLMGGCCATPDLLWEIAVQLRHLEEQGLTRRRGDIHRVAEWLADLACAYASLQQQEAAADG